MPRPRILATPIITPPATAMPIRPSVKKKRNKRDSMPISVTKY